MIEVILGFRHYTSDVIDTVFRRKKILSYNCTMFLKSFQPPLDDDVTLGKTEYEETRTKRDDSSAWDWIRIEIEYDNTFERLDRS